PIHCPPVYCKTPRSSGRLQQRFLHSVRQRYWNESVRRVQIILTTFIDHSKVAIRRSTFVWQHSIDLVNLQRCQVILVVDANHKFKWCFLHSLSPNTSFVSCPSVRCHSFIPV